MKNSPLRILASLLLLLPATAGVRTTFAQVARPGDDTVLKQIILFGRHGVRSAAYPSSTLATLATRSYPDFGVPTGYLTLHGAEAEVLLGAYYRQYLLAEGLLTGDNGADLQTAYFRANSIQRSNLSATTLGLGLFPFQIVPVHSFALGTTDALFDPISTGVAAVDTTRVATEAAGVYNNGTAIQAALSPELSLVRSILLNYPQGTEPPPAPPAGILDATSQPIPLTPVTTGVATFNTLNLGGLGLTLAAADPFVMEYENGFDMSDVAWGSLNLSTLSQQTRIITYEFAIALGTPYLAQVQASNSTAHILRTMEAAETGTPVAGELGTGVNKLVVVNSSDAYVAGVARLLGVHWQLPGFQPDYCAPGGNLVFELRTSRSTGQDVVRVFYTAQTFDQLRNLNFLSNDAPPATQQLLVPGGSASSTSLDIPFATFDKLVNAAINQADVANPATEVQPPVLPSVPLY